MGKRRRDVAGAVSGSSVRRGTGVEEVSSGMQICRYHL
jgi:hypothetical protein